MISQETAKLLLEGAKEANRIYRFNLREGLGISITQDNNLKLFRKAIRMANKELDEETSLPGGQTGG